MKALSIKNHGDELKVVEMEKKEPKGEEVLVELHACGVCHTDVHAIDGDWQVPTLLPLVPGHEGIGTILAVGENVKTGIKVGDRVGVAWLYSGCGACEYCITGREVHCLQQKNTGYTEHGCFSTHIIAHSGFVVPIPKGLSDVEAAPILCAGVTTYKGLKNTGIRAGEFITILGAGGGLGHMAVQYANAMGMRVIGVDIGDEKLALVKSLGAEIVLDARNPDMVEQALAYTHGGSHAVLCLATALPALKSSMELVRVGGTIVLIGLPKGEMPVNIVDMVLKGITLKGSLVGTRQDLKEALDFAARGKVKPHVYVCDTHEINNVMNQLRRGDVKGRIVLDLSKFV